MDEVKLIVGIVVLIIVGLFSAMFVDMHNVNQCVTSYAASTRSADEIIKICKQGR